MFNNISIKLSLKFFNLRKPLELVLFDKLFNKFVTNLKNIGSEISKFHENGYVKINPDIEKEIEIINDNLKLDESIKEPPYKFIINKQIDAAIKKIIYVKIKNEINDLEVYFNCKIVPAMAHLRRNTHYHKVDFSHEHYSDNFHNDAYALTHFKIFFNLMNVTKDNGPMHIVSKKNTKNFLKKINYKDRTNYNQKIIDDELLYSNIGKKCDTLIFDPTQCLHRATIPSEGNFRDYLTVTFICLPKKKSIIDKLVSSTNIYVYKDNPLIRFAKPHGFRSVLKLFFLYLKKEYRS